MVGHNMHAPTLWYCNAFFRDSVSKPYLESVGTSKTCIPSVSIICKIPKYIGDSTIIASHGFATALRDKVSASVAPVVIIMSSGVSFLLHLIDCLVICLLSFKFPGGNSCV